MKELLDLLDQIHLVYTESIVNGVEVESLNKYDIVREITTIIEKNDIPRNKLRIVE